MIEQEVIHTNSVSKRIFDFIQNVLEFVIVFMKMLLGALQAIMETILPKKLKDVSGEIVLITGAGHGIGRELALHYTAHYSTVVCVDINEKSNEDTVKSAKRLNKGAVFSYTCNVTDREAVLNLAHKVKEDVGPVSVLINNAGIMPINPLEKQTAEDIRRTFDINVFSHFWTLEAFLPHMKEQNRGHIVAMSSISGLVGLPNLVPYSATKFAVRGLMESLYTELRSGPYKNLIKTTTICPYMTNTGLCKNAKVRFPSIFGLLDPKEVAAQIVQAQRSDENEVTVPSYWYHVNRFCRLLPLESAALLMDYVDSGVQAE
ncbi:short-chain dehydrogenase/reductase family 16C member 6 [Lucilia sericata]|uniref:short-chain dehydrogenase/reductase family 16C member 6 n=1 Tax=Lucilia sericata TaxID=13632 RepID=UPI0018A87E94|nr:short-chain dehydrogenase/reductase family 16C member 6 [Lucilia sericata]XP_037808065.1 short-chain dehydrogenase/reductase family 16C member 6 [Lucilia sericata]XP_037808066.1 short-chain dehydrogenase/reductase family 16C member 6 [Lucilia sericata]